MTRPGRLGHDLEHEEAALMASRVWLANGAPRLLGNHNGAMGRRYLRAYTALASKYGPFTDELTRMEAGRAAHAWTELEASTRQLADARRKFNAAKGRHGAGWNAQAIGRLSKRVGLNDITYLAAVRRLEDLISHHAARPHSPHQLLKEVGRGPSSA